MALATTVEAIILASHQVLTGYTLMFYFVSFRGSQHVSQTSLFVWQFRQVHLIWALSDVCLTLTTVEDYMAFLKAFPELKM